MTVPDYLADPEFRLSGPWAAQIGAGDSIAALNIAELPESALALVQDPAGLWVLDKNADPSTISDVAQAALGGVGSWFLLQSFAGERQSAAVQLSASVDLAVASNTWTALSGATTVFPISTSALFTLTSGTGRLVYNGPSRTFRIELLASVANTAAAAAIRLAIAAGVNGDVSGATDYAFQQESTTPVTPQDMPTFIVATRDVSLATASTIDPMFKNITDGTDINIIRMMMTITPSS